jgi:hypothetical protein
VNCSQCGQSNPVGFKFCSKCGAQAATSGAAPLAPPVAGPGGANVAGPVTTTSAGLDWNRVSRFELVTVVGAFLTLVGLYLPWLSAFGFSVSGIDAHGYLWLSWLCLVAVIVLSIIKVFSPGFSETWPFHNLVAGLVLFAALMVVIGFIDTLTGSFWSFGPFWTLLMIGATSVAVLTPLISGLDFLRLPVSTTQRAAPMTTVTGSPAPTPPGTAQRFCSACGNQIVGQETFCSRCGNKIDA